MSTTLATACSRKGGVPKNTMTRYSTPMSSITNKNPLKAELGQSTCSWLHPLSAPDLFEYSFQSTELPHPWRVSHFALSKPFYQCRSKLTLSSRLSLAKTLGITLNQVKAVPDEHTGTRCTWLIPGPTGELQHCGRHIVGDQSNLVGHYQKHMSAGVDAIP